MITGSTIAMIRGNDDDGIWILSLEIIHDFKDLTTYVFNLLQVFMMILILCKSTLKIHGVRTIGVKNKRSMGRCDMHE